MVAGCFLKPEKKSERDVKNHTYIRKMSSDEKADQTLKKDSNSQEKSSTEALVSIVQYDMI